MKECDFNLWLTIGGKLKANFIAENQRTWINIKIQFEKEFSGIFLPSLGTTVLIPWTPPRFGMHWKVKPITTYYRFYLALFNYLVPVLVKFHILPKKAIWKTKITLMFDWVFLAVFYFYKTLFFGFWYFLWYSV